MKIVALIIVMQLVVTLITGCAEFPIAAKMEEMRSEQLTCSAEDESLCAGWKM
jgi:hypothetical protein